MRARGWVFFQLAESGSASGDAAQLAAGLIVAPTGATVAVSPLTEAGANWFWHTYCLLHTQGIVGGVSEHGDGLTTQRIEIDNKAMRKLREDESIYLVMENQNLVGSPGVNVGGALRVLTQR